ncbi:hypothetical protein GQ55_1G393000 [Panicum hallii var. hallii]|uniref:Uncharacterized protein n=1 Tax=Panicum hallii var. hallii TaxID=1504633 RepID=A0A2T7FC80_9POAL|nr:hypothetical protein GQ55_1G393000 [Panicum hallii var. hallii]
MDEFPLISDHSTLLQGHGVLGAEGCLGIRSSEGKSVPTQDDRKNKRKKDNMFDSDWPELASLDDFEPSPRNFDPTFEIGSSYFEDTLWSSNFSPEARLVPSSYFDGVDFSIARDENTVLKTNPTKTKQQSRNGASDTPLNCAARGSSSSGISDAELLVRFDNIELGNQIGCCEGLEAILCPSQEMQASTASSSMCSGETVASSTFSGPDSVAAHILRPSKKPQDPFSGAPDMILEEMAGNPLDMYFPPLATYEQPGLPTSDATSAQKHRFPEELAGSHALNCAESQLCAKEIASAGLRGQPSSAVVLEAVPVKELGFHKLQEGMNQLDLATKGRIRDALYRLANGVEQRHCVAGSSGGVGSSGSKSVMSRRFRSGNGWTETQTNPMDQSVAHLLLKKPSYGKAAQPHRVA